MMVRDEIEELFDIWWEYKVSSEDFLTACNGVLREDAERAFRAGFQAGHVLGIEAVEDDE